MRDINKLLEQEKHWISEKHDDLMRKKKADGK